MNEQTYTNIIDDNVLSVFEGIQDLKINTLFPMVTDDYNFSKYIDKTHLLLHNKINIHSPEFIRYSPNNVTTQIKYNIYLTKYIEQLFKTGRIDISYRDRILIIKNIRTSLMPHINSIWITLSNNVFLDGCYNKNHINFCRHIYNVEYDQNDEDFVPISCNFIGIPICIDNNINKNTTIYNIPDNKTILSFETDLDLYDYA